MLALLHREDRALICGDAFANGRGKLGDPLSIFTYDLALNRQSQAKLAALDFDHLLVSHGPPILNEGRARAQALVASRAKKKK
jgi:glyoxylase-like metal-dependent hydrolase (beta-lactamase superfamily II)